MDFGLALGAWIVAEITNWILPRLMIVGKGLVFVAAWFILKLIFA
jgi:hypothetical protein